LRSLPLAAAAAKPRKAAFSGAAMPALAMLNASSLACFLQSFAAIV
jgi:hypothetical protein